MSRSRQKDRRTDLVLLHPGRPDPPDTEALRHLVARDATVVAIQVPTVRAGGGLDRDELAHCHHQHGVDLARLSPRLRLRDIVLLRRPDAGDGACRMALVHVWNTPDSHYDIDAVRIPWETLPGPRDKRNNPRGKNPSNVWAFSATLDGPGNGRPAPTALGPTTSYDIEAEAIRRLVRCHAGPGATVHAVASARDEALVREVAQAEGRTFQRLPSGAGDPFQPIPMATKVPPETPASGREVTRRASRRGPTVTARFLDGRAGLRALPRGAVTHAVTSPPYNIGYNPFNVTIVDPRTGEGVAPDRKAYADTRSPEQYAGLLESTFAALEEAADPAGFELFLNLKNNYQRGRCNPPFYVLRLLPDRFDLVDLLVWRYDISFDPARFKYKPVYEWVLRVGFGSLKRPRRPMADWYVPILKGNSLERRELAHPAMFPRPLVHRALTASGRRPALVVDPFLGSGTTLAACLEAGVDGVGFEVLDEYQSDVERRLQWAEPGAEPFSLRKR